MNNSIDGTSRRRFLQGLAMLGVGGQVLLRSRDVRAAVDAAREVSVPSLDRFGWAASVRPVVKYFAT